MLQSITPRRWLSLGGIFTAAFAALLVIVESNVLLWPERRFRDDLFDACRHTLPFDTIPYLQTGFVGVPGRPYFSLGAVAVAATVIVLGYLVARHRVWSALLVIAASAGGAGLAGVLKSVIVGPGTHNPAGHSFPSGHAAVAVALCLSLAYLLIAARIGHRWKLAGALLLAVTLGLATLSALTFHYPTEVAGGYLLAVAWWAVLMAALAGRVSGEYAYGSEMQVGGLPAARTSREQRGAER